MLLLQWKQWKYVLVEQVEFGLRLVHGFRHQIGSQFIQHQVVSLTAKSAVSTSLSAAILKQLHSGAAYMILAWENLPPPHSKQSSSPQPTSVYSAILTEPWPVTDRWKDRQTQNQTL